MDSPASDDDPPLPPNSAAAAAAPSLEIRLFYVRIAPCAAAAAVVPPHLTLTHLRRPPGAALEVNGAPTPSSSPAALPLRLSSPPADSTYVSTDRVRLTGGSDFEVADPAGTLILCGSLHLVEAPSFHKTGWSMDCYSAASIADSAFVQPKLGVSAPSIEVYVAGIFAGAPLILTQTVSLSPRRKAGRLRGLDAIPEDEEGLGAERTGKELGHVRVLSSSSVADGEIDEFDSDMKVARGNYPEGWYVDDDGQLSWFNAGVRVGVGIGLGMCVGIGVGVGLLMRSYQATTRGFRRRFF